jgi:DNA primase
MMGRFGDDKIEEVRARADIVEVIGAHVRLRRSGRNFMGLCPFHQEKTPSFSVNPERGFFHCFGCGAGGTVFNFIMRMDGLTFPEAVRTLADRYGVDLPERDEPGGPTRSERDAMLQANQVAADFYAHVLWRRPEGEGARAYLRSRGISDETARAFLLGFAPAQPAALAKALEKRGLREAGVKAGLVKKDSSGAFDMFRARLMFPIRDVQGRVLAFGGRVLDDRLPKYINSPESPLYSKTRTLYGLYEARQAIAAKDRAVLVEGYIDVIMLWQAGFKESVAGCGTALTVEQLRVLARYTKNVLACFDGDAAGRKASLRALEIFLQAGMLGRGIFIPAGFDPDTFIREQGAAEFERLIGSAELLVERFIRSEVEAIGGPGAPLGQRTAAAESVIAKLRLMQDELQFNELVRLAADYLRIDDSTMRRLARRDAARSPAPARNREASVASDAGARAEMGLLAIAVLHPALRPDIAAQGAAELFEESAMAALMTEVCSREEPHTGLVEWLGERLTPAQQSAISAFAVGPLMESAEEARALASDYLSALRRRRTAREVQALKTSARDSAGGHDEATAAAQALIALRREDDPRR